MRVVCAQQARLAPTALVPPFTTVCPSNSSHHPVQHAASRLHQDLRGPAGLPPHPLLPLLTMPEKAKSSSGRKGRKQGTKRRRSRVSDHVQSMLGRLSLNEDLKALYPTDNFIVSGGLSNALPDVHVGPFFMRPAPGQDG